ncbi:ATP-binding protein, partial [Methylopila musalis]
ARATLPALRSGDPLSFALRAPEVLDAVRAALGGRAPMVTSYAERVPIERWFEVSVTPIVFDKVGAGAAVVTLRDLTEQRRSERMRVDFIANASHELRTPLASLLGFIETLQGPARNDVEARARFLEIMRTQAGRMSRLIDDLLSLSRIELKAHVRPDDAVEISGIVSSVIDAMAPLARDRNVELGFTPPDAPVWALGDRDELIRVVENLIENAVKYGAAGGRVETSVTAEQGPQGVRIAVRDFGPGIAPEHLPRLTERFYRGDAQASREAGGTGLGLALVKHILQRHGGQLAIESRLGEGALFTATLDPTPKSPPSVTPEALTAAG